MFSFKNLACDWRLGTGVAALVAIVLLALPALAAAQEGKGAKPPFLDPDVWVTFSSTTDECTDVLISAEVK